MAEKEPHMRRSLVIGAAMASLAGSVQASEPWEAGIHSKLAVAAARSAQEAALAQAQASRFNWACGPSQAAFCYDAAARRLVYRGGRRLMPSFEGLTAEGISVRHDRIVLRYSFR
jgi:hypothetical protein